MSKRNVRVTIPKSSPDKLLKLIILILLKDAELGDDSPLKNLDMKLFKDLSETADTKRKEAEELRAKSEATAQESRKALGIAKGQTSDTEGTAYNLLLLIRDQLLIEFSGVEERLEEFGFNVVISIITQNRGASEGEDEEDAQEAA